MQLGICSHCRSVGQRFYETDRKHKHRVLKCFTCGNITHYLNRNGTVYTAPPWEPEDEIGHYSQLHAADQYREVDLAVGR